jgi:plasmid stabilization system protein ParE
VKLRFSYRALQDLAGIADYIRVANPKAAEDVRSAIIESLQNLILFPSLGRLQSTENVRKFITRKYRYIVYYTADEPADEIIILTIQHPARDREFAND